MEPLRIGFAGLRRLLATPPPGQELPAAASPEKEPQNQRTPSAAASAKTEDAVQENETADSGAAARERSPGLSIQDVTGSGRGPVLRKMKPVQLSQDVLNSLAAKAVVVRVVIDRAGKVTEVTPLNQEEGAVSLPPDALATIQQWEFSSSRRKEAGECGEILQPERCKILRTVRGETEPILSSEAGIVQKRESVASHSASHGQFSLDSSPLSRTPQSPPRSNAGMLSFAEHKLSIDQYVVHTC